MRKVKILGPGCANCRKLEALAREAAAEAGIEAEIVKVSDLNEILSWNLVHTPGLVIDERLVASARIPTRAEIKGWLTAPVAA